MPAGVASTGAGCGGAGCDGVVRASTGFGVRFFDFALLADFATFFIPFFFLLSRWGTALCLLGFFRHVHYPDQNYAATAQPFIFIARIAGLISP
jgi:hypothetical protein